MLQRTLWSLALLLSCGAVHAQWDTIVGDVLTVEEPDVRWVAVRGGSSAYLVDTDEGVVKGTLPLSRFSPTLVSHASQGRIYSYGSFYTRDTYGERTDVVLIFDIETASPVGEVEIPARAAGIGHRGMISVINDAFVGVFNLTPAQSVSLVDTRTNAFVNEISLAGCSSMYPIEAGFMSICGDGTVQYIEVSNAGQEVSRVRSEPFFDLTVDPVYDYASPASDGWMIMSFDGYLRKAYLDGGEVVVTESFNINPENDGEADINGVVREPDDNWRIGGRQPFAYHDEAALLATVMHQGGGQETFEKAGTEIWAFNMKTGNRGYRLKLDEGETASAVMFTPDAEPLMLIQTNEGLRVHDPVTGRHLRTVSSVSGSIFNLF
ncbi:amine dehydrogenase large subunit [Pseudohongiella sp. O18]|uniref:amine dehydrogenase large subunit n=1 Tax=Pseudohongiella sp. O18 TaxID=2904248 RepID=UPI001F2211A7|nr:amine dehydrogenase large subunit [Pseudohongiella sp. O18]